ncbi:MAG: hypothetical protein WCT51_00375 [Candidatus Shapirobacteria bacterium]|jgi:hypothetical protein
MNQVINDFKKGLGQLGVETAEKLVEETGKIAGSVITARELLGDIKPLNDQEIAQRKAEDENKKQEEMSRLRQGFGGQGRNVENEMEKLRRQQEKEEEEKGNIELENLKRQREMERQNQMANLELIQPSKHHKDKGGNKRKTQQPDQTQMSQTSEYKGKIDK